MGTPRAARASSARSRTGLVLGLAAALAALHTAAAEPASGATVGDGALDRIELGGEAWRARADAEGLIVVTLRGMPDERFAIFAEPTGGGARALVSAGAVDGDGVLHVGFEVPRAFTGQLARETGALTFSLWTQDAGTREIFELEGDGTTGGLTLGTVTAQPGVSIYVGGGTVSSQQAMGVQTLPTATQITPPSPIPDAGPVPVIVELKATALNPPPCVNTVPVLPGNGGTEDGTQQTFTNAIANPAFVEDASWEPMCMPPSGLYVDKGVPPDEETWLIRGEMDFALLQDLYQEGDVLAVWRDAPVFIMTPLPHGDDELRQLDELDKPAGIGPDTISGGKQELGPNTGDTGNFPPCVCFSSGSKLPDMIEDMGVDDMWNLGWTGSGITVGIVDAGCTLPQVAGGWAPGANGPGTVAGLGGHGNMTGGAVLSMAPNVQLYDIRVLDDFPNVSFLSDVLSGYRWAIDQYKSNGTPQILSNSWGIWEESWAPGYASDPKHPVTRKIVEAVDTGILVTFAAGNCGEAYCTVGSCGTSTGPGNSIWGANGAQRVITVGATDGQDKAFCWSSQGPAALYGAKPDLCTPTAYRNPYYAPGELFPVVTGTSGACATTSGVIALIKEAYPTATQEQVRFCLQGSALDIWPTGFDMRTGSGRIRGDAALLCQ